MEKKKRPIYKRILRLLAWLFGIVVFLIVLVTLLLQTNWAQEKIRKEAVSFLEKKLHTGVEIAHIKINWLYNLEISGVKLNDQQRQTLFYLGKMEASYRLLDLLGNQLTIHSVAIDSLYVNAYRPINTDQYNFSYILQAFSDSTASPDTLSTGTAMKLNIGKISIRRADLLFNDQYGGQYYSLKGRDIETRLRTIDPEQQLYEVEYLETLLLNGTIRFSEPAANSVVKEEKPSAPAASTSTLPKISIGKITLKQTAFRFEDQPGGIKTQTYAGFLQVIQPQLLLSTNKILVKNIAISDHFTSVLLGQTSDKKTPETSVSTDSSAPFSFYIEKTTLARNTFRFDDNTSTPLKNQLDYAHLLLEHLNLGLQKISYNGNEYKVQVDSLSAKEKSGLQVKQLKGILAYSNNGIEWENGYLQTNRNEVSVQLKMSYDSLAQFTKAPEKVLLNASFQNTTLVLDDLLFLSPDLAKNEYVQPLLGKKFRLQTTIRGPVNHFEIPSLSLREGANTLNAAATISGLPDPKKLIINLTLKEFSATREGLLSWLPKNLLPENIQLPDRFTLSGTYKGTLENMNTRLSLKTSSGNIALQGVLKNIQQPANARYDLTVKSEALDLGYLLKNASLGKATVNISAKGKGLEPNSANASFSGNIGSLEANNYTYTKMALEGSLRNSLLNARLQSEDPNLQTNLLLEYSLDSTRPSLKASMEAFFVDLKKLGFSTDDFTFKGKLDADLSSADPNHPEGSIQIHEVQFGKNAEVFTMDSILINAARTGENQEITIRSPFLQANLTGKYGLTDLATQTNALIQRYLSDRPDTIPLPANFQEATITGTLSYPKFIATFVPEWKSMTPMKFQGSVHTGTPSIQFETATRQIRYSSYIFDSLRVRINGNKDSLDYFAGIRRIISSDFPLYKTYVSGGLSKNNISWAVATDDKNEKERYKLAGNIQTTGNKNILTLSPDILLNGEKWSVNPNNQVVIIDGGLAGGALELKQNNHSIQVTTGPGGVPVEMSFSNFPLEALSNIIEKDTALVEGYLNGKITVPQINPFSFEADLMIDSLKGMGYPVGKLTAKVNSREAGIYNIDALLGDNGNKVTIEGYYNANDSGSMKFAVNLDPINMRSLQPVVNTYLDSVKGFINGQMTVSGTPALPVIRGSLNTSNASLIYKDYNTFVNMPHERMVFDEQGILLNEFVLADSSGNEAILSGRIQTTDYSKFNFNLKLDANNFLAVNKRSNAEQWIYGPASIDADLTVKGNMDLPVIEGQVKMRDESQLTVVIKEDDPGIEDRKGIIVFVNKNNPIDSALIKNQWKKDSVEEDLVSGISLSVNVEITPSSTLTIVLDEMNGDQLQVKGAASLNTSIDASGKTSMTGRYEVNEGKYQLSLNQLIKRNFDIVKGGTIIWNGDPLSATLDLSAVYKVNTTAYTLIQDLVSNTNTAAVRQRLPFEVYLNIDGEMMEPEISFKLDMPERERNAFGGIVYTRLKQINQDLSELNKQVMGLLVLNNFIADNPFSSLDNSFSGDLESTARRTAGKILGQQLNNLLGDVIKGVDLNFDLESQDDFSTGSKNTQTDLNISASKNLFNDRTTVTIGSSVGVEGSQNASSLAGDVSIEYKVSRDGRYRIKLYRINNDEAVIQGQFIETGVSFILFMDYNRFRELFQKTKQEQIQRKRNNNTEAP